MSFPPPTLPVRKTICFSTVEVPCISITTGIFPRAPFGRSLPNGTRMSFGVRRNMFIRNFRKMSFAGEHNRCKVISHRASHVYLVTRPPCFSSTKSWFRNFAGSTL